MLGLAIFRALPALRPASGRTRDRPSRESAAAAKVRRPDRRATLRAAVGRCGSHGGGDVTARGLQSLRTVKPQFESALHSIPDVLVRCGEPSVWATRHSPVRGSWATVSLARADGCGHSTSDGRIGRLRDAG